MTDAEFQGAVLGELRRIREALERLPEPPGLMGTVTATGDIDAPTVTKADLWPIDYGNGTLSRERNL